MASYRDEGVVLRSIRLGEADRIVTLVTPGHGKVRAVAKGVRRTKSRIGGRVEPLSHVTMLCWHGRELDTITQVEVLDTYRPIREDLARMGQAMLMLEVVDQVVVERQAAPEIYRMLVGALGALAESPSPLVAGAFLWKLLAVEGVGADPDACAGCGSAGELVAFDPSRDGFLCRSCQRGQAVGAATLALIRRVLGGDLAGALRDAPAGAAVEVERLAVIAAEHHLERRLRVPRALPDPLDLQGA